MPGFIDPIAGFSKDVGTQIPFPEIHLPTVVGDAQLAATVFQCAFEFAYRWLIGEGDYCAAKRPIDRGNLGVQLRALGL